MENNSLQLHSGSSKEKRRDLDFYPTPKEVTIALLDFLKLKKSNIVEPACGDGAMSKVIESYGHHVFSSDIRTSSDIYGLKGIDFLTELFTPCDAIITNPPFSISDKFIEKALTLSPCVCMVLKSQYWHAKKRIGLFNENMPAYILPLTWRPDFMNGESGGAPTMEVAWTVWIKGNSQAKYIPLIKPDCKPSLF